MNSNTLSKLDRKKIANKQSIVWPDNLRDLIKYQNPENVINIEFVVKYWYKLLMGIGHVWKSVSLIVVMVWIYQSPNIFKLLIMIMMLIVYFRYLKKVNYVCSSNGLFDLMQKSKSSGASVNF